MNREELERKIAEASEGGLTHAETSELESELRKWPELQRDYLAIMNLPDINQAYPVKEKDDHEAHIDHLLGLMRNRSTEKEHFTELSLHIFKKYALAASVLLLAGSSALLLSVNTENGDSAEEIFTYQAEGAASDNYLIQIDNLLFNENSDEY